MEFWTLIALLCSGYCLYKVHELESSNKEKTIQAEVHPDPIIYARLKSLVGETCEVKLKEPMVFIDVLLSIKGTIIDCDEHWVIIQGKKDMQYLIRLIKVKDVAQIL